MRTLQQIREAIQSKLTEAESIQALATSENREPTAEEAARIDAIVGSGDKPGELSALRIDEERAVKLEAIKAANVARHEPGSTRKDLDEPIAKQIRIPANAHRTLKNIKGEKAHERAYAFGRWFLGAMGNESSKQWAIEHGFGFKNAMTEGIDSKGGFVVPETFENFIIDLRNEYGIARAAARVIPMTSDTTTASVRTGGLTAYPVGEAGTGTASDKSWGSKRLTAKKWMVLTRYSSELSEDAVISIADDLVSEIAYAFANKEDDCFFNGDGTSTYHGNVGIKNALLAGSEITAATGNTSFGELDDSDFLRMCAALPSYAYMMGGPEWYIHRAGYHASMARLMRAAGGNTADILAGGTKPMFNGFPVNFVEVMNSTLTAQTSTEGLCYFGNLKLATLFGDRRGMAIAQSADVYFTTDELAIRGTERFDVNIHDTGTASAAGGIIQLLTPGS